MYRSRRTVIVVRGCDNSITVGNIGFDEIMFGGEKTVGKIVTAFKLATKLGLMDQNGIHHSFAPGMVVFAGKDANHVRDKLQALDFWRYFHLHLSVYARNSKDNIENLWRSLVDTAMAVESDCLRDIMDEMCVYTVLFQVVSEKEARDTVRELYLLGRDRLTVPMCPLVIAR